MKSWVAAFVLFCSSTSAFAFPDMIRHGYTQCTACHVAPNGGSLLTAYGRGLSEELLSTWSYKGEGNLFHGAFTPDPSEKGYFFGGDVRSIQVDKENPTTKDGRFFVMQAEVDAAVQKGIFTGFISVGQITKPTSGRFEGNVDATRFWGMAQVTEQVSIRVGRFTPQFGLNMPDHELVSRMGIGFYPGLQYDTAEAAYLGENWTVFAGAAHTIENTLPSSKEKAATLHVAYAFWERFKTGASAWIAERDDKTHRQIYSANAQLGITPKLFLLYDVDYQVQSSLNKHELLGFARLGYEAHKGVVPYLQFQNGPGLSHHYAIGGQFFPRPHFEIAAQFDRIEDDVTRWSDVAYILGHYYF